jgi:hypothetical protein
MARRKKTAQQEENVSLGPQVPEGEEVFGVCHIFASFNDTFVHVTDLSGRWVNRGVATVVALPNVVWACLKVLDPHLVHLLADATAV